MTERTWKIDDGKGGKRTVTLAQFRAEMDTRRVAASPIMDAILRGDISGCAAAQAAFRTKFR